MADPLSSPLKVSSSVAIQAPPDEQGVVVAVSQWRILMARIEKCKSGSPLLDNAGWFCLGIAALAAVSLLLRR